MNTAIPDGNLAGLGNVINITDWQSGSQVTDVQVTINVTGGYNGDLYAYLSHGSGFTVLLNRVGRGTINSSTSFGYGDTGFAMTFAAGGADVHWYGTNSPSFNGNGQLAGTWGVDGRNISPLSSRSALDANGTTTLASFNGGDPNGNWTIFFADAVSGDQATLVGWSLDISATPEPTDWALIGFTGIIGIGWASRRVLIAARSWISQS